MAWVSVDEDGAEFIYDNLPIRKGPEIDKYWHNVNGDSTISLPSGTIEKLIGRQLTWEDDPVELQ